MPVAEVIADFGGRGQAPVVEHPAKITVYPDRIALLDDECTVQTPTYLFEAALMRVIPVAARIDCIKFVNELSTRRNRRLR